MDLLLESMTLVMLVKRLGLLQLGTTAAVTATSTTPMKGILMLYILKVSGRT